MADNNCSETSLKRCGRCQQIKPVTEFGIEKKRGKPRCYCYECRRAEPYAPRIDIRDRREKLCPRCKEVKPISEFRKKCAADNREALVWHHCRECNRIVCQLRMRKRIESGEATKDYKKAYKTKRWVKLLNQYGIEREEYERMEREQGFRCAICGEKETAIYKGVLKRLCVDHDHETKKIRALLCRHCNIALGNMKEDIRIFKRAIAYLEKHKEKRGDLLPQLS